MQFKPKFNIKLFMFALSAKAAIIGRHFLSRAEQSCPTHPPLLAGKEAQLGQAGQAIEKDDALQS